MKQELWSSPPHKPSKMNIPVQTETIFVTTENQVGDPRFGPVQLLGN